MVLAIMLEKLKSLEMKSALVVVVKNTKGVVDLPKKLPER